MNKVTLSAAAELLAKVRVQRPLVHHITNHVTSKSSAAMALACGASPVMAEDAAEVVEVAKMSSALLLNLGTISAAKYAAMQMAQKMANARGIPVVLDPVGAGSISVRRQMSEELLRCGVSSVRGNAAELAALGGLGMAQSGVDAVGKEVDLTNIKNIALNYGCITAATGPADYVSDGVRTYAITNGHKLFAYITGAGCMAGTLTAAFCAVCPEDFLLANVAALLCMGVAGELAAQKADGPGSFEVALLDAVYKMTEEDIVRKGRLEALS